MATLDAALQAIAFIEAHLREEVGVGDIADAVGYSLYHFTRTFNAAVHHPPYDYLIRRRLSESVRDLVSTDRLIIDIAYEYAFANPETYTRAFRRMFGTLPSACRSQGCLPYRAVMPRLTRAHLAHRTGVSRPPPQVLALPRLALAGPSTLLPCRGEDDEGHTVRALWQLLVNDLVAAFDAADEKADGTAPAPDARGRAVQGPLWAVLRYTDSTEDGRCLYAAAASAAHPPPLTPSLIVPGGRYVRCDLDDGSPAGIALIRDYIAYTWLPRAGQGTLAPLELLSYDVPPTAPGVRPASLYMALA